MDKYTKPNLKKSAIITVDTQNDFTLPGAISEVKGTNEIVPQMKLILETVREKHMPIIHLIRIYEDDGSNVDNCRRELIEMGTNIVKPNSFGADLVDLIKLQNGKKFNYERLLKGEIQPISNLEWVIYKPRWGAFYQTKLENFLISKEIDTLVFIGCNFPNCPRTSIYEASERNFKVGLVEDAMSGIYERGIKEIKNIGGTIYRTSQLIQKIKSEFIDEINSR